MSLEIDPKPYISEAIKGENFFVRNHPHGNLFQEGKSQITIYFDNKGALEEYHSLIL